MNYKIVSVRLEKDDGIDLMTVCKEANLPVNRILKVVISEFLDDYYEGNSEIIDAKGLMDKALKTPRYQRKK